VQHCAGGYERRGVSVGDFVLLCGEGHFRIIAIGVARASGQHKSAMTKRDEGGLKFAESLVSSVKTSKVEKGACKVSDQGARGSQP
jgi:hypothetical protein